MTLVPDEIFQKYRDVVDEFTNTTFGINCRLEYPPKEIACINCIYDVQNKKSTNKYKTGGPIPFSFGICPHCNGRGFKPEIQTDIIKLRVYWDKKSWLKVGIPLNIPDGMVQAIGFMSDLPKIKKSQKAVLNSDQEGHNSWAYKLSGEPIPHGFGRDRYVITYWERA